MIFFSTKSPSASRQFELVELLGSLGHQVDLKCI